MSAAVELALSRHEGVSPNGRDLPDAPPDSQPWSAADGDQLDSPPHSIEAEQSILGALLVDNGALSRVADLAPADFFSHSSATIFAEIRAQILASGTADEITVFERLKALGRADECGGLAVLNALKVTVPSASHIERYADIVREHATRRRAIAAFDQARAEAYRTSVPFDPSRALETLAQAPPSDRDGPPRRFKLLDSNALRALPAMPWNMKPVLPAQGCAAIFGARGTAKSFLALHMAACIEEGRECFGYRCRATPVVYVGLEGGAGIPTRVRAWEVFNDRDFPCRVVLERFSLRSENDVLGLAATIAEAGGAGVVIIDTLARAAAGSDENAAKDMGELLAAIERLQSLIGGLVIAVHHAGKNAFAGLRGHSSLDAGLDAIIETKKGDSGREWVSEKVKEGEDGKSHRFRLLKVDLGEDEDGDPITSCVIDVDRTDPDLVPQKLDLPTGGNQKIVLDALVPLFRETTTFGKRGAPAQRPCVELEAAVEGSKGHLAVPEKRRRERAQQAIQGLVSRGVLGCSEGWLWRK